MTKANLSRRGFLRATTVAGGTVALGLADPAATEAVQRVGGRAKSCIVLFLTGGPSQLETWDPKPDAPSDVRGPFRTIATDVAGIRISEHLPKTAGRARHYAIVRTVHHNAPPVHEAGMQLMQTGRLSEPDIEFPHFGAVLARYLGPKRRGAEPFVILPFPLGNTGISVSRGQTAGFLGADHEPRVQSRFTHLLAQAVRKHYGMTSFGDSCARSVQLVERGARCVVVNMFDTLYDRVTWDCHADRHSLSSTLDDYRRTLCPTFDGAFATLLDDLRERGLLDETLVVAMGEFGRTPRLNGSGGRDHWPGCWSIVMAGGGVRGGQTIGASDRLGAAPAHRPVTCGEVVASIYHALGLPLSTRLTLPDRRTTCLVEAAPVRELFN